MTFLGLMSILGQLVLVGMGAVVIATGVLLTGLVVLAELGVPVLEGVFTH